MAFNPLLLWYVIQIYPSIHCEFTNPSIHPSIDLNQTDKILQEFDAVMAPCANNNDHFDLIDTASLLWRLNVSYSSLSIISSLQYR